MRRGFSVAAGATAFALGGLMAWLTLGEARANQEVDDAPAAKTTCAALTAYAEPERACTRKALLIHSLASLERLTGADGRLWYFSQSSAALKAHWLTGRLATDLSAEQRRDVAAFVEGRVIPALRSEGDADRDLAPRRTHRGGGRATSQS